MSRKVALLHYASPPGVGGVEALIAHQAYGLAKHGYSVRILSGKGEPFDPHIETVIHPLLGSTHPDILTVKGQLDRGLVSLDFEILVGRILAVLHEVLADCDVCIAHNILSLNKNLPLTAALAQFHAKKVFRLVAWCSDLAWTNPQYLPELHTGYPWNLLRSAWPNTRYVTISPARHVELADLFNLLPENISIITPGIDPAAFFRWTSTTIHLVEQLSLMQADGLLLLPARLTRRKNIALALHVLAALRQQSGLDFRLIITGPPGPHNPTNPGYLGELLALRQTLDLTTSAHFLYAYGESPDTPLIPDDATIADFYRLADALFFPSTQEGFGIPILEAGLSGLPIFCADIPPLRQTALEDASYFDPVHDDPEQIAAQILQSLTTQSSYHLRKRVRHQYHWETIIREQVIPLLEDS